MTDIWVTWVIMRGSCSLHAFNSCFARSEADPFWNTATEAVTIKCGLTLHKIAPLNQEHQTLADATNSTPALSLFTLLLLQPSQLQCCTTWLRC